VCLCSSRLCTVHNREDDGMPAGKIVQLAAWSHSNKNAELICLLVRVCPAASVKTPLHLACDGSYSFVVGRDDSSTIETERKKHSKAVSSSKDRDGEDVRQGVVVGSKRCQEAKEVRHWND
jgi:hypothetical protein